MSSTTTVDGKGTGWVPDLPSIRDYTLQSEEVAPLFSKMNIVPNLSTRERESEKLKLKKSLPKTADLRKFCSPVEDQGALGSCTANAGVGMIEYFERRAFGRHIDASRLFLYKATRNLLRWKGDTGAYLRTTMGAMKLFGVPPEEYWPYKIDRFDQEPPAFCYAFASSYQTIKYVRLDANGVTKNTLLNLIKENLAKGLPAMFGFTVYESIEQASLSGNIPFPSNTEKVEGGHAVMAVGYNDELRIKNEGNGVASIGAFLIRNSWSKGWGNQGYGYLPYEYVLQGIAVDWWTVLKNEWVDTGHFGLR